MKNRLFAMLICAVLVFSWAPVFSDEINLINNGDFESSELLWSNAYLTGTNVQSNMFGLAFSNPYDDERLGNCHITSYEPYVALRKDTVYKLDFWLKGSASYGTSKCLVDIDEYDCIKFTITGISEEWKHITARFMVEANGEYNISLACAGADFNTEVYIDNISLSKIDFTPATMDIEGQKTVYIPDVGAETYEYKLAVTDGNGNSVPVVTGGISVSEVLPRGVSFDSETCVLTVDSTALNGSFIKLTAYSVNGLPAKDITIKTVKSFIENGTFENLPLGSGWAEGDYVFANDERQGFCIKINNTFVDENLYYGALAPERQYYFEGQEDKMYVWRAKVRSDAGYTSRGAQTDTSGPDENGEINISISNIGGEEWTSVSGVIDVLETGIYVLKFNFLNPDERPVYIDDIAISVENPMPADIVFNAPAYISLPKSGKTIAPFEYAVRDQGGNVLTEEAVTLSVKPENAGLSVEGNCIIVSADATERDYVINAVSDADNDVRGTHTVIVNKEKIGDGSFEKSAPGELWATAYPSAFNITQSFQDVLPSQGQYLAKLTMNGAVSVLFSDSVCKYSPEKSYVFEADMRKAVPDIDTVVTVLVAGVNEGDFEDNMVVGQFSLENQDSRIQEVFTPSEEFTGRMMIAFSTPEEHEAQIILMDNIIVADAKVSASNVYISGNPFVDKFVVGKYSFSTNFNGEDASSFKWLISNTEDGVFMPIEGEHSQTLSVTSAMNEKYIKFEITPISLRGPVVGESVASGPIKIGEYISDTTWIEDDNDTTEDTPEEPSVVPPEETVPTEKGELVVIELDKAVYGIPNFVDMNTHWARNDVNVMAGAGIVNGIGNGLFDPEGIITRAEFSTFIIRAFGLAPTYYNDTFDDVKSYSWYAGAIATVTKYDIANGISEREFSPETPITREQMAVMIMRAYQKTGAKLLSATNTYKDSDEFSSWARESIEQVSALGIMKGKPGNYFEPHAKATRAEAVVAIKRMIDAADKNM